MVEITLPDGTKKEYTEGVTGCEIAGDIGAGLLKAALAMRVNGMLCDLKTPINDNADISIITGRDEEGLEVIRHDTAHIMAQAVQELYPDVQVTIGPSIENGFYYDFARDKPFHPEDLEKIEKRMQEIVARDIEIDREEWDRNEAIKYWQEKGEPYKVELLEAIPEGEVISFYRQGEFMDLCRGPHAPSTGKAKAFKLMKIAGAYWRGDSNNAQLQRIYGTAWADKKQLKDYLHRLEEAEKRDHRRLGTEMNLFHMQHEAVGQVFWHDKGWTLYRILENYIRDKLRDGGYQEVKTPIMVDRILWEKSGHWEKFRENMFTAKSEDKDIAMKPMNCPCHVQIFNQGIKSYRDLPLRMAEFGMCHRNEPSGAMHGLMRVRGFVQDDAHIFCTEEQITSETVAFCNLLQEVYQELGFDKIKVKFSDRPETRAGSDAIWDKAEASLTEAVKATGLEYSLNPGEGAFYGPKLEFVLTDAIGRDWQCGTIQVDFVLPERLGAGYIADDGEKHYPVMLHRAILGSFERFIGILIEQYAGKFPLWLAPTQVAIATVVTDANDYAVEVEEKLKQAGIRVVTDIRNEKISYKVREHSHAKVPVILALGMREAEQKTVSVRRMDSNDQTVIPLDELIVSLQAEISSKSIA